jgi:hypothetical protein
MIKLRNPPKTRVLEEPKGNIANSAFVLGYGSWGHGSFVHSKVSSEISSQLKRDNHKN